MTEDEVAYLLRYVVSLDGRRLSDLSVAAWLDVLGDVPLVAAKDAARDHYRDSTEWLMPAHILRRVRAVANQPPPVGRVLPAAPPLRDPERLGAILGPLRQALAARRRADGEREASL